MSLRIKKVIAAVRRKSLSVCARFGSKRGTHSVASAPATTTSTTTVTTVTTTANTVTTTVTTITTITTITSNGETATDSSDSKDTTADSIDSKDTAAASCDGEDTAAASCDGEDTVTDYSETGDGSKDTNCSDGKLTTTASCDGEETAASCDENATTSEGEETATSDVLTAAEIVNKILSLAIVARQTAEEAEAMYDEAAGYASDMLKYADLDSRISDRGVAAADAAERMCDCVEAAYLHIETLSRRAREYADDIRTAEDEEEVAAQCRRMKMAADEKASRIATLMPLLEGTNSRAKALFDSHCAAALDPKLRCEPGFWANVRRNYPLVGRTTGSVF
ncbi:hypothetical protein GGF42_005413 [Coemansia sp. RSA 2424]|nr:hypothetical protein GGF42_005413 [Coemansia sp. RSA 2424]